MLNLPIGSRVAASNAACVAPKSLPSSAFVVHLPSFARYSRLSASSMRMRTGEDSTDSSDLQAYKTSRSDSATDESHLHQGRGCSCNLDRSRAWSQNHFPRYLDGLRIRSSLSASSLCRTVCRRLCWTAFTRDWGSNQACLTRWIIVRQTIFRARIGWYLRAPCPIIRLNCGFRTEFKQNRFPSPELR